MTGISPLPLEGNVTAESYCGLMLDMTFRLTGEPLTEDALAKTCAAGYRAAIRDCAPGWPARMKFNTQKVRERSPDAEVSEVAVRLSDGLHRFTWEEFEAWLDGDG